MRRFPSRTICLDAAVSERQEAFGRPDETRSDAVDRLLGGRSLLDLVGRWSDEASGAVRATLDAVDADATAGAGGPLVRFEPG